MIELVKTYEVRGYMQDGPFRLLFESNPQPMWVFAEETLEFLAVNEAAIRHYGYTRSEFMKMTVSEMRPQSELPSFLEYRSQLTLAFMEFGAATQWRHRTKDGTIIDVECKGATVRYCERPARLIIIEDITERKKTADRLRETADNFQVLFETAFEGIAIHQDGCLLSVNPAFAAMLGLCVDECSGKSILNFIAPESHVQVLTHIRTVSAHPVEFSILRGDGTRLRSIGTVRPIRFHGNNASLLWVRDISERVFSGFADWLRQPVLPDVQ